MSEVSNNNKKFKRNSSRPAPKIKKCVNAKPTATAYLQVIGNGAGDTSPSLFLFADSQRYVFGCGEATQRLLHEHKFRLGKIHNVFLTQLTWQHIGGLPGLLLTLREACKQSLTIHGPPGLSDFLAAGRCFMSMYNVDLKCAEYSSAKDGMYKDENIIVIPISIKGENEENFTYNSKITEIIHDKDGSEYVPVKSESNINKEFIDSSESKSAHSSSVEEENPKCCKLDVEPRTVVNYVCELIPIPGKMNVKKALELGVPSGPLLGKLQKGEDVTLENGLVVKTEDVMEKSLGGSVFCIIDCPSEYHLKQLQTNDELTSHEEGGKKSAPVIMIHLSPTSIVQMQEYQTWTKRFGSLCQHLFLNSKMCPSKVAMFSQLGIQYCLNQLNPKIFPPLFASDKPEVEIHESHDDNWTAGEPYLIYHLRPNTQKSYDKTDISNKWNAMAKKVQQRLQCLRPKDIITNSEIKDALNDFINPQRIMCRTDKEPILTLESSNKTLTNNFEQMDQAFSIVFLGTGASLPSKYRNVSCTLVNISANKVMLLDCGEGSYGQLYRHYGQNLDNILRKLCCIFISHIHADHHLGLIGVLQAWEKSTKSLPIEDQRDPVAIIGPRSLLRWLQYYGGFCETLNLRFHDSCQLKGAYNDGSLSSLLESKVSVVPVEHCPNAFGLTLYHRAGWKLVYSGDTRPCDSLVEEGLNATVLIHEATLEDDLYNEALAKQHSTTSEAIQCGQKMQAKFTLLNHFSQRYPKIPVFNKEFSDCVGIAFDHMQVSFQNLIILPKLLQSLQEIFQEEAEGQTSKFY